MTQPKFKAVYRGGIYPVLTMFWEWGLEIDSDDALLEIHSDCERLGSSYDKAKEQP